MKLFKETTVWETPVPNHTYLLSDDKTKLYAYIKVSDKTTVKFTKPIRFESRGRKFVEVKDEQNLIGQIENDQESIERWEVKGSKGDTYIVQKIDNMLQCNCAGFTFRGNCRHVKQVEEQNA